MKHYVIGNDNGSPVYFDHPNGEIICMPLTMQLAVAKENFNDNWRTIRCEKATFVFGQKSFMTFLAVSDQGDSENYLRLQIRFLQALFILKYGPEIFDDGKPIRIKKQSLCSLFNTVKRVFDRKQCYLLNSIEKLEASDEILNLVAHIVKKVLREHGFDQINHILITVGTKILLNFVKPGSKSEQLSNEDILTLMIFIRSHFRPISQDFTPREVPISDYRDHDLGLAPEVAAESAPAGEFVSYESDPESQYNFVEEEEEENESGGDQPNSVPSEGIPIQKTKKKQSIGINASQSVPVSGSGFLKEEKSEPVLSSSINSQPVSTPPPMLKPAPLDYQIHKNQTPLHSIVHLGYPTSSSPKCEYGIHSYEIMSPIVLTILTRPSQTITDAEKEKLWKIRCTLKKELQSFLEYFVALDRTHLEANKLSFIHQLPGLTHFIFVDRTNDRLYAPNITSLAGQHYNAPPHYHKYSKEFLKRQVWDMVFQSQGALMNGYSTMLMAVGDFQYSYKLWFEDENNVTLPIDKPLNKGLNTSVYREAARKGKPVNGQLYRELTKRLFPNQSIIVTSNSFSIYTT